MGKGKKKKNTKSQFDDFFETAPTEAQWLSGVSAAAMDTDERAVAASEPPATTPTAEAMDTAEGVGKSGSKLGLVKTPMKRGQRTTNQKKRKNGKLEKALARNERIETRVTKISTSKQRKASLKHIY